MKTSILLGLLLPSLGLLPCFSVSATIAPDNEASHESAWNIVREIPRDKVVVQSHRGAGVLAEENTLEAFELGWKLGTYPEADLRTTRDGVIVAFHDADFSRVVRNADPSLEKKGVEDLSFDALSRLDVGSWRGESFVGRRIRKMSDIFSAMTGRPERHLYLDIKNVDLAQLAREVSAAGVQAQVVLASPKHEIILAWKRLLPEAGTLLWMRGTERQLEKRFDELEKKGFAGITQLQIHIFPNDDKASTEPFALRRSFVAGLGERLRAHGILFQTLPYTPEPKVYSSLLDLGVASFATDYPDVTQKALDEYYAGKAGSSR